MTDRSLSNSDRFWTSFTERLGALTPATRGAVSGLFAVLVVVGAWCGRGWGLAALFALVVLLVWVSWILRQATDLLSEMATNPSAVRVWVVLNHRRISVHSVTCDEAQSLADLEALIEKYDGDIFAATRTVGLVYPAAT